MRSIVKEASFEEDLRGIEPDAKRADEFIEGAEWVLSRNPTIGTQVNPNSCVWFLPTTETSSVMPLVVYYTFNEERVHLLSVQIAP